jgi:hypothetical protein
MPNLVENPLHDPALEQLAKWALLQEPHRLAAEFARRANGGDKRAKRWISRLYLDGMTLTWQSSVDRLVRKVDLVHNYKLNKEGGTFQLVLREWGRIHPVPDESLFPSVETVYAWIVMRLVNAGLDTKVKQCAAPDCCDFHFKRGKWCYKDCGSRIRVREKRKRDREAGML